MKTLFSLISIICVALFAGTASAADCGKQIQDDKPLWGSVGVIVQLSLSPMTEYNEIAEHGPGVKYVYTVRFANGMHFKSWSVMQEDGLLKPGYKFAWIPKVFNPSGLYKDLDQFFPTAFNEKCEAIRLDHSWNFDDLVGSIQ